MTVAQPVAVDLSQPRMLGKGRSVRSLQPQPLRQLVQVARIHPQLTRRHGPVSIGVPQCLPDGLALKLIDLFVQGHRLGCVMVIGQTAHRRLMR